MELRSGVTLLGGQPVPAHRFGVVLEDAASVSVHAPEAELRTGVALLGSQSEPAHGFGIVLENALAQGVHEPEAVLRIGGALLGVNEEPSYRCGIVAAFIRRRGFVKCLRRRDRYAEQHSQQRQGDNTAANQPVFNACL